MPGGRITNIRWELKPSPLIIESINIKVYHMTIISESCHGKMDIINYKKLILPTRKGSGSNPIITLYFAHKKNNYNKLMTRVRHCMEQYKVLVKDLKLGEETR